ncbi:MAG: hypothetical protein FJ313_06905, partial [Gemmatimonadetes bacterium]|nr:hypothetical protein [Gemmatimonadota bacterium]
VDSAILSGDDSETHMDFDTTAAKDHRKLSKGLRKVAIANSVTQDLSTFTADNLLALRAKMGEFGMEVDSCAWIVESKSGNKLPILKDANNNLLMTRVSDLGPQAAVLKGVIGELFGSPVISCPKIRTNLAATGVNTEAGPNTYTVLHYVWRPAWAYGVRREPVIESFRWVGAQLVEFVINIRIDFEHGFGSEKTTGLGIKIS